MRLAGDGRGVPLERSLGNVVSAGGSDYYLKTMDGPRREGASELKPMTKSDGARCACKVMRSHAAESLDLGVP